MTRLNLSSASSLVWLADLKTDKLQVYQGSLDYESVEQWTTSKLSVAINSPERRDFNLDKALIASGVCDLYAPNYCLIGYYGSHAEMLELTEVFQRLKLQLADEPVELFVVARASFKPQCFFLDSGKRSIVLLRTKRRRYTDLGWVTDPTLLLARVEALVGGNLLERKMSVDLITCFK